jgi:uncharacterized protein (DUF305 family)
MAEQSSYPGIPSWVKILGLVALGVVAIVVVVMITGAGGNHGPGRHSSTGGSGDFDRQFIDMMVPHHEGAVEMAKIAQQRGEHAEIKELANAITRSQDEEIRRMKAWRQSWYGSDKTPPMSQMPMVPGMGRHGGGHSDSGTMNMAEDVDKLRKAPAPFDKAFIDAMIPHHESAIEAARAAETRAEKPEIKALARSIIADQEREITQMKQWKQTWYPAG